MAQCGIAHALGGCHGAVSLSRSSLAQRRDAGATTRTLALPSSFLATRSAALAAGHAYGRSPFELAPRRVPTNGRSSGGRGPAQVTCSVSEGRSGAGGTEWEKEVVVEGNTIKEVLIATDRQQPAAERAGNAAGDAAESVGEATSEVADSVGSAAEEVRDSVGEAAQESQAAAEDAGEAVVDAAQQVGDTVAKQAEKVGDSVADAAGEAAEALGDAAGDVGEQAQSTLEDAQVRIGGQRGRGGQGQASVSCIDPRKIEFWQSSRPNAG